MSEQKTQLSLLETNRFHKLSAHDLNRIEQEHVISVALEILSNRYQPGEALTSPKHTFAYLRLILAKRKNEVFGCIFLDTRHRVIKTVELFHGTIDGASVYPRVVAQKALELNAAATLFFHNHPSGVAEPSQADIRITEQLKRALDTIDVRVLDHVVIGDTQSTSMAQSGLI